MRNRFCKFYKTDHQGSSKNLRNSVGFNSLVNSCTPLKQISVFTDNDDEIYLFVKRLINERTPGFTRPIFTCSKVTRETPE